MRIVLDTNVPVSGAFFGGAPSRIVDACVCGLVKAVVSREVLAEYCRVGEEFARARPMLDFARFLSLFTARALMVNPPALERPVCRDPHDDMFIACAIGGRADLIVSGDKDSLSASEPVGVRGVTPRGFLDRYLAQEG